MKITLQNIGLIKNSTIQLDGLTVITGKNNSGKTTVGKVLYSLFDAVSNMQVKARNDRLIFIEKGIGDVTSALDVFRLVRRTTSDDIRHIFGDGSIFDYLFIRNYRNHNSKDDIENFAHKIYDELSSIDFDSLEKNKQFIKLYGQMVSTKNNPSSVIEIFKNQIANALVILEKLFEKVDSDSELIDYARESINQTLRKEFANQIQPVGESVKKSSIKLTENDAICFSIEISNNIVKNNGKPVFISAPYKQAYLIDNPFIIDSISPVRTIIRSQAEEDIDTFLNTERIITHDDMLKFVLKSKKTSSVFEDIILGDKLAKIKQEIDQIIPGQFEFNEDGEYYVQNGHKLKTSNLATGSKMFSIIKILLEKGELDETTMLVLDEPETHLHPSWQNKFAEIIVLLVKELNVNILLTTHSSNFMLAIDAYMRKHSISRLTNFYQTNNLEDGFVEYQCVNDEMGKIYADFMQYLSEVKVLRDNYIED